MTSLDRCITQIVPLIEAGGENAFALADVQIDQLQAAAPAEASQAALLLAELQARLIRQVAPSPLRSDVLDAIGTRIVTLLEAGSGFDA